LGDRPSDRRRRSNHTAAGLPNFPAPWRRSRSRVRGVMSTALTTPTIGGSPPKDRRRSMSGVRDIKPGDWLEQLPGNVCRVVSPETRLLRCYGLTIHCIAPQRVARVTSASQCRTAAGSCGRHSQNASSSSRSVCSASSSRDIAIPTGGPSVSAARGCVGRPQPRSSRELAALSWTLCCSVFSMR